MTGAYWSEFGPLAEWTEEGWLSDHWILNLGRISLVLPLAEAEIPGHPVLVDAGLTVEDEVAMERIRARRASSAPPESAGWSSTDWAHWEHLHIAYLRGQHVVEFGGGYGNMARLAVNYLRVRRWTIVDHPVMLALQARYLTACGVEWAIWRPGLPTPAHYGSRAWRDDGDPATVLLVPSGPHSLDEIASRRIGDPDVLISTFALSETDGTAVDYFRSRHWLGAPHVAMAVDLSKCRTFPATQRLVDALVEDEADWCPADWPGAAYAMIESSR